MAQDLWLIESRSRSPRLEWSSLQPTLKRAECDVLIFLDCCFASSAVRGEINGINEIIAACGRESETVARGEKTFTKNLIRKIKSFGDQPFAAIEIHKRMIKDRKRLLASPHYDNMSGWNKPSIVLVPRKLPPSSVSLSAPLAVSELSSSSAESQLSQNTMEPSTSRISEALDGPRVLLALSLAADANVPELEGWIHWLTNGAPPEIRNLKVKYESIYHGHSTLLLVSMPVTAWMRLPSSSGFRFVDVVTSENLITQAVADKGSSVEKEVPDVRRVFDKKIMLWFLVGMLVVSPAIGTLIGVFSHREDVGVAAGAAMMALFSFLQGFFMWLKNIDS